MKIAALLSLSILVCLAYYFYWKPHGNPSIQPEQEWPPEVIAKVYHDRQARDAVKANHPKLFQSVSRAMFEEDPVGLNYGNNTDEYDAEAGTIIPRLPLCNSADEVTSVVHEEFVKWFGAESAGKRENYVNLGQIVWELWQNRNEA